MAVLVTGASGFIGLALTEALLAAGHEVVAFDAAPMPPLALAQFRHLPGRLTFVAGDVRTEAAVARAIGAVDRMVIAAAVTAGAEREAASPEAVVGVNVQAVAMAVRLAAAAGLQRVVHVSSVAVYGASPNAAGPLSETLPCYPTNLYGLTKSAGEATALRLAALCGVDLVAARLGTCCGPWEHPTGLRDTLSPQFQIVAASRRGEPVVLETDAVRDWVYVRDAVAGLLALLWTPSLPHRIYNVGSGAASPLSDWCRALLPGRRWRIGLAPNIATWGDRPPASIRRLLADTSFRPQFGPEAAAADWLDFLQRVGSDSLLDRAAIA